MTEYLRATPSINLSEKGNKEREKKKIVLKN